ncbi:TOBE domain-containing protein (plasmid) [Peribacillus sp. JNUCC 23]|uniref:TOBE domain-containing protein n=1 Tax=Peribacillus sp. NPDC096379 TaxID=3364393 RepID=UPI0038244392
MNTKIEVIELLDEENILHSQIAGQLFTTRLDTRSDVKQGHALKLAVDMNKVHLFDYKT